MAGKARFIAITGKCCPFRVRTRLYQVGDVQPGFEKFPEAELLAGVATAGIAWGAMAADQLKLPYIYVRPKPKEHGLGNQIEGFMPGDKDGGH